MKTHLITPALLRSAFAALLLTSMAASAATPAATRPEKSSTTRSSADARATSAKVDLNTADAATLESLPGVGPEIAKEIIAARPFKSVSQLEEVRGIGPARMKDLKPLVTVSRMKPSDAHARVDTGITNRPTSSEEPSRALTGDTSYRRVNLNTASREELEALPEIGPVKAQAIMEARPFRKIEDVMKVKGIKEGTFEAIKDRITVH